MKKSLFKIISVLFISTMIFVSCSNLFDSEKSVDGGYQISGTVSPYDFAETSPARTAFPTAPDSTTIFYYTVTATLDGKTVIDDVEGVNGAQFNLKIPSAGEWSVTASCFGDSARQNLLYKTTTPTVIKVSNDSPSKFANLTLKPLMTTGKTGTLNLEIDGTGLDAASFHPSVIHVECISGNLPDMDDRISYSFNASTKEYTLKTKTGQVLPSGSYTFNINFITPSKNLYFYSVTETVNIYDGLVTNRWVKNGDEEYITSDGKFVLTDAIVNKFQQESIYVDSSATNANASGTWIDPYKSLDAAIDSLKANPSIKIIFVTGNLETSKTLVFRAGGNVTHDLTIKKNPRATAKPVVTTDTQSSFITVEEHKIIIENIDFKGCGNNLGVYPTGDVNGPGTKVGAFLHVGPYSAASAEITNCTISDYYSNNGGAISTGVNSNTTLTNVDITRCKASKNGGAIYAYGNVTYVSGNITDCSATEDGGAICISNNSKISLTDITIANCKTGNENSAAIDIANDASNAELKISGENIIAENYYGDTETKKNVRLETADRRIIIAGDIAGSKIGVSHDEGIFTATIENPATFTTGFTKCTASAGSVFFDDSGKTGISVNPADKEAAFTVSGGVINVVTSQKITFTCQECQDYILFYPGIEKEIDIKPALTISGNQIDVNDELWENVIWTTWLTCDGIEVPGTRKDGSGYEITAVIPKTVIYEDNYILHVKATVNELSHDASWPVKGKKDISYMSAAPTAPGTYSIASSDGLKTLKGWVTDGKVTSTDFVFELTEDLNVSTSRIGTSEFPFKAVFDGKGHTLTGLNIGGNSDSALFTYIDSAIIKNLTIEGSVQGADYTAGIVGKATNSEILNCTNKAAITAYDIASAYRIAGICNTAENTTIDGCVNEGSVQSTKKTAAGILAQGSGTTTVKNCVNRGSVKSTATGGYVAGIVGEIVSSATVVIDGCRNEFNVESTNSYAAGIATGGSSSSIIRNCINTGAVTSGSSSTAGGIQPAQNANIYNCYNTGTISNSSGYAGGIVAKGSESCVLSNCFSYAGISGGNVGNISGNNTKTAASINNYFIVKSGSSAQNGAGTYTSAPYTYDSVTYWDSWTQISQSIIVGTYNGQDVKDLLNAWIDTQGANASLYKRWNYGEGGIPELVD